MKNSKILSLLTAGALVVSSFSGLAFSHGVAHAATNTVAVAAYAGAAAADINASATDPIAINANAATATNTYYIYDSSTNVKDWRVTAAANTAIKTDTTVFMADSTGTTTVLDINARVWTAVAAAGNPYRYVLTLDSTDVATFDATGTTNIKTYAYVGAAPIAQNADDRIAQIYAKKNGTATITVNTTMPNGTVVTDTFKVTFKGYNSTLTAANPAAGALVDDGTTEDKAKDATATVNLYGPRTWNATLTLTYANAGTAAAAGEFSKEDLQLNYTPVGAAVAITADRTARAVDATHPRGISLDNFADIPLDVTVKKGDARTVGATTFVDYTLSFKADAYKLRAGDVITLNFPDNTFIHNNAYGAGVNPLYTINFVAANVPGMISERTGGNTIAFADKDQKQISSLTQYLEGDDAQNQNVAADVATNMADALWLGVVRDAGWTWIGDNGGSLVRKADVGNRANVWYYDVSYTNTEGGGILRMTESDMPGRYDLRAVEGKGTVTAKLIFVDDRGNEINTGSVELPFEFVARPTAVQIYEGTTDYTGRNAYMDNVKKTMNLSAVVTSKVNTGYSQDVEWFVSDTYSQYVSFVPNGTNASVTIKGNSGNVNNGIDGVVVVAVSKGDKKFWDAYAKQTTGTAYEKYVAANKAINNAAVAARVNITTQGQAPALIIEDQIIYDTNLTSTSETVYLNDQFMKFADKTGTVTEGNPAITYDKVVLSVKSNSDATVAKVEVGGVNSIKITPLKIGETTATLVGTYLDQGATKTITKDVKVTVTKKGGEPTPEPEHYAGEPVNEDGVTGYLNEDLTTVTVTDVTVVSKAITIPATVDGFAVSAIDPQAFKKSGAKTVYVKAALETIGKGAFKASKVKKVYFFDPAALKDVGKNAFKKTDAKVVGVEGSFDEAVAKELKKQGAKSVKNNGTAK